MIHGVWQPDPGTSFRRRLGMAPQEPGSGGGGDTASGEEGKCPDIWELDNGDIAVIGRDLTATYRSRLPAGVSVGEGERLVIVPRAMVIAAEADLTDE
jgi:hypothetical protein